MWNSAAAVVFALVAVGVASNPLPEVESLVAIQNLTVANISSTTAYLRWDLSAPSNVSLRDVIFWITKMKFGEIVTRDALNLRKKPLRSFLSALEPNTTYTVKLHAESIKFPETEPVEASFTTLEHDRPQNAPGDSWEINWELTKDEFIPGNSDIEVCDPECNTQRVTDSPDGTSIPIKPDGPYYVGATAIFKGKDNPQRFIVLERRNDSIHLKIEHEESGSHPILQMNTHADSESPKTVFRISNLATDTPVRISAHFCSEVPPSGNHRCRGSRLPENITTTEEITSPSPIRSLGVRRDPLGCLEVEWNTTLDSRGPIDGYAISMKGQSGEEFNLDVLDSGRRRICDFPATESPLNEIKVYDFNVDTLNRTLRLDGGSVTTQLPPVVAERGRTAKEIFVLALIITTMCVVCFCCCGALWLLCDETSKAKRRQRDAAAAAAASNAAHDEGAANVALQQPAGSSGAGRSQRAPSLPGIPEEGEPEPESPQTDEVSICDTIGPVSYHRRELAEQDRGTPAELDRGNLMDQDGEQLFEQHRSMPAEKLRITPVEKLPGEPTDQARGEPVEKGQGKSAEKFQITPVEQDRGTSAEQDRGIPMDQDRDELFELHIITPPEKFRITLVEELPSELTDQDRGETVEQVSDVPVEQLSAVPTDRDRGEPVEQQRDTPVGQDRAEPVEQLSSELTDQDRSELLEPLRGMPVQQERGTPVGQERAEPIERDRDTQGEQHRGEPADSDRGAPVEQDRGTPASHGGIVRDEKLEARDGN